MEKINNFSYVIELDKIDKAKDSFINSFTSLTNNSRIGEVSFNLMKSYVLYMRDLENVKTLNTFRYTEDNLSLTIKYVVEFLEEAKNTEIIIASSSFITLLANIVQTCFHVFSTLILLECLKIQRPDITADISNVVDEYDIEKCNKLTKSIMVNIAPFVGKGFLTRPLKYSSCTRDCTRCPLFKTLSLSTEDVIDLTRAHCPVILGRQSIFISGQMQSNAMVMYRNSVYPVLSASPDSLLLLKILLDPVKLFNNIVKFTNSSFEFIFDTLENEQGTSLGFYMSGCEAIWKDVALIAAKGYYPLFVPGNNLQDKD